MSSRTDHTRGTGEVARQVTTLMGEVVTERQIQTLLRRVTAVAPSLVAGRRAWRDADVAALIAVIGNERGRTPRRSHTT